MILGQDTPNTWHSPTHTLIRAVALFAFLLIISVVERVKQSEYQKNIGLKTGILIALLLFCSNLAKPNFVQVLYPALVFYMIYHLIISRGRAIKMGVQLALTCIPSLLLMIYQYISAFYNGSSAGGVTISWFEYWHIYTPSIPISMLLVLLLSLIHI